MSDAKMLSGKVALITGGYQGIGKETALVLAEAGADIALVDVMAEVEETAKEVAQLGVKAAGYVGDVTNLERMSEIVDTVVKEFGRLDILVNNAGITRDNLLVRMSEDEWDKVLAINLKGMFVCTKAVVRTMMKQRSGKIVNIASVVGLHGNAGQCNYSASKAGAIGFTKSAARELASRGINVNAVAPGFIQTAMTDALGEKAREELERQIPMRRLGTPRDVAQAILFLVSPAADYITGEVIRVDGGMAM